MTNKLILDKERDRRFMTWIGAILAALIYFYEFPLYWLLRAAIKISPRYAEVNQDPSEWIPPVLTATDLIIMTLIALSVAYVYLRPRHFIQFVDGGAGYRLFRNGHHVRDLSREAMSELEVFRNFKKHKTYDKGSKGWREGHRCYLVIRVASDPEIVLLDQTESWWRRHQGIVQKIESFFGDIRWKDKEGIVSGRVPASTLAADQKTQAREKQVDTYLSKRNRRPPEVQTAWGARILFALVFAGFGLAFWIVGGYRIVGLVFLAISFVILADMVLAMLGFGQQQGTRKKKK